MIYYLKLLTVWFAYTLTGAFAAIIIGYTCGAIGGLALTFYNNNFMVETAQGSYLWWANFGGYLIAVFSSVPGLIAGFMFGLIKFLNQKESSKATVLTLII